MLDLDLTTILFEIANFVLLSLLLYRFLFQPLNRRAQAHAAAKEAQQQQLVEENRAVAQLKQDLAADLAQSQAAKASLSEQARQQAASERERLLQLARDEAERILNAAHVEADQWQRDAYDKFHDEMVTTLLSVCRDLLGQLVPKEAHDAMVAELNQRVWRMGQDEMDRVKALRIALAERKPTLQIKSAQPLSAEQRTRLAGTFAALADQDIVLELETEPTLVAGLQARLGDLVVENSLLAKLQTLREEISQSVTAAGPVSKRNPAESVRYVG